MEKWIQCVLAYTESDWLQPPVFPDSLLCSFPQVPLFVPVSFTIICLFTVAMSFYSDPVSISIGCTMVLSGFPVYYLIIHRQMSDRCLNLFCEYAFDFQCCGPKHARGLGCWFVPRAHLWCRFLLDQQTSWNLNHDPWHHSDVFPKAQPPQPDLFWQRQGWGLPTGGTERVAFPPQPLYLLNITMSLGSPAPHQICVTQSKKMKS